MGIPLSKGLVTMEKSVIMLLQNIGCFSAKPQSISFGKVVHKGIFSEFDFEFNAPQKKKIKNQVFQIS